MKRIMVDVNRCTGCRSCELACRVRHTPGGSLLALPLTQIEPVARLFVEAVGGRPVPAVCRHCVDAPCAEACLTGAMGRDPQTGLVTNEGTGFRCVGCWMCIQACPYGVIQPVGGRAVKCDGCPGLETPACVAACAEGALIYAEVDEFSVQRRQRMPAVG
ncbi:MAG: 4Fe-4S dicluster domain-containing protein [Thermaerobacter sp.]|nr:4Fe-4S dicluster domain-containing protein [Thermaerobacter sp.]